LATIFSCTEKPDTIGLDLVDDAKFSVKDTILYVKAYSTLEDSMRSDETSTNLLGSQTTETFGLTKTSFYTHLRLQNVNPNFGPNPVADSIILNFVYSSYYGNLSTQQTAKVYRVEDDFWLDSIYYSDSKLGYDSITVLGELTFVPNPNDSVMVDSALYPAELRIPMNQNFADIIFEADSASLSSNENFIEFFKGLYVTSDDVTSSGEGSILYFDLLNERSNLTLYYQNDTVDSLNYVFTINTNNARIGRFQHDYSLSNDQALREQVLNNDTSYGSEALFVQGLAGIKTVVKLPGITEWAGNGSIAVNQAKLFIPTNNSVSNLEPPASFAMFQYDENESLEFLRDFNIGESYFGGSHDSINNLYQFRISLYTQELFNGSPDYGLVIFPISKAVRANGVKLFGTDPDGTQQMKLELFYTDIYSNN